MDLQVLNIADPQNIFFVSSVDIPDHSRFVTVKDGIAYLACGEAGLQMVDVSDPLDPLYLGGLALSDEARVVDVTGQYAYVADFHGGLQIVDVSDPTNPFVVSSLDTGTCFLPATSGHDEALI